MKQIFRLKNQKPLSVNNTYVRTHSGVRKSADAGDWFRSIFYALSGTENQAKLAELRGYFDAKKHIYKVCLTTVYPEAELLTKQGVISSKTQDLSNTEKSIIDAFFLPKHCLEKVPDGVQNLDMDDKTVCIMESRKAKAPDGVSRGLIIEIEILPMSALPIVSLD